jgi:hypothetical protein
LPIGYLTHFDQFTHVKQIIKKILYCFDLCY